MLELSTNYLDDILAASMNGKRKYRITHSNGLFEEVTIEDISEYDQIGSNFGAGDINKTNQAVNKKFDSDDVMDPMVTTEKGFAADASITGEHLREQKENLTASNGVSFKFDVNENGEYGYIVTDSEGADTVIPFRKGITDVQYTFFGVAAMPSGYRTVYTNYCSADNTLYDTNSKGTSSSESISIEAKLTGVGRIKSSVSSSSKQTIVFTAEKDLTCDILSTAETPIIGKKMVAGESYTIVEHSAMTVLIY